MPSKNLSLLTNVKLHLELALAAQEMVDLGDDSNNLLEKKMKRTKTMNTTMTFGMILIISFFWMEGECLMNVITRIKYSQEEDTWLLLTWLCVIFQKIHCAKTKKKEANHWRHPCWIMTLQWTMHRGWDLQKVLLAQPHLEGQQGSENMSTMFVSDEDTKH